MDHHDARAALEALETMLEPDGYGVVVQEWPAGPGHARIEVVALEGACEDCLVPKELLAAIVAERLPAGVQLEAADLVYPGEPASSSS